MIPQPPQPADLSLGDRMRRGTLWMFTGSTGSQILTFAFGIVLARLLAPEVFGMLLTIQVFTGIASFVAGGGMGQALVRARDTSRADYDIVFTLQLLIGSLIYGFFFFTAPYIAAWYGEPLYADLIRVSALTFFLRPFNNVPSSILHREMRYKELTLVVIVSQIVTSISSITLAYLGYGVWSLILGGFVGPALSIPAFAVLAKWRPGISFDWYRARDIARYGIFVSITDILVFLGGRASTFIMSFTLGPSAIGLYNKGESLAGMPNGLITGSVYKVLFRGLAAEQEDLDKCRYLFFRSIMLVAVYGTPFYIGLLWIAEPLVRTLYGQNWAEAATPLFILAFAWPFWMVNMLSGAVLAAFAWLHREVAVQASTLIVATLTILIGLSHGIAGVALAWVATAMFASVYMYLLATSCLKARRIELLRALLPAAALGSFLYIILALGDALFSRLPAQSEIAYLVFMISILGFSYVALFFGIRIRALASERARWIDLLSKRVPRPSDSP